MFGACSDDIGEPVEEVGPGRRELIATDKPAVFPKLLFDPIVVEGSQGDGCLPDPACTDESDGSEIFYEANDLLDESVASKQGPWWWGWGLPRCTRFRYEMVDPLVV